MEFVDIFTLRVYNDWGKIEVKNFYGWVLCVKNIIYRAYP